LIAEPTQITERAMAPPAQDERSMLVLQLIVAGLAILATLLLSLAH
jgi:hypothetical protein